MHPIVLVIANIWIGLLFVLAAVLVLRAETPASRVLMLDMLNLIVVAWFGLIAHAEQAAFYLDAALLLALLSFVATLAAGRYLGDRKVFA